MKNKKIVYTIIGIVSVALIALAITYAYWQLTKTQEESNVITLACLDISIVDAESGNTGVTLQEQYPLSDSEGAALKPYKFTVTNKCDTAFDYHVNLESIGDSEEALQPSSIKVMLDEETPTKLSVTFSATPTIEGAYASHKIGTGRLAATGESGSSVTHELRLWIDEDAPVSEANKTFISKVTATVGQGINYSEVLIDTLLADYGGKDNITEIDKTKKDVVHAANQEAYFYASNSYYWGTKYTMDSEGNYKLDGTIVKSSLTDCRNGTNTCGNYTIQYATSETATSKTLYEVTDFKTSGNNVTANRRKGLNDFEGDIIAGMYKAEDDYGTSYYYRGDVTNNYVKFGSYVDDITEIRGYYSTTSTSYRSYESLAACRAATSYNKNCAEVVTQETAGKPMYWRIIRINGDGTIRLIYDGTSKAANGESDSSFIKNEAYNSDDYSKTSSGYMYGTEADPYGDNPSTTLTDSKAKKSLDSWYDSHLVGKYKDYIADSIFCNDREEGSVDQYGTISYKAGTRYGVALPSLICSNQRDRFTVDDTVFGNGHLIYPVGLITADELLMTGDTQGFLNNSDDFWTSSPYYWSEQDGEYNHIATEMETLPSFSYGIRPVINLKVNVEFTIDEDGTYVIKTD